MAKHTPGPWRTATDEETAAIALRYDPSLTRTMRKTKATGLSPPTN